MSPWLQRPHQVHYEEHSVSGFRCNMHEHIKNTQFLIFDIATIGTGAKKGEFEEGTHPREGGGSCRVVAPPSLIDV